MFLIPYILFTDIDNTYKILILLTYFILLAFEIINTAIEKLCNKITKKYDKDIKVIKDISSASVFVILIILLMTIIVIHFIVIIIFLILLILSYPGQRGLARRHAGTTQPALWQGLR